MQKGVLDYEIGEKTTTKNSTYSKIGNYINVPHLYVTSLGVVDRCHSDCKVEAYTARRVNQYAWNWD